MLVWVRKSLALIAIAFFFTSVLERRLVDMESVCARQPRKLPVALSPPEVKALPGQLSAIYELMAGLMVGTGMRLMECILLWVQDVNFNYWVITVRDGKGNKDRVVPLPEGYRVTLEYDLTGVEQLHNSDLDDELLGPNRGEVFLP